MKEQELTREQQLNLRYDLIRIQKRFSKIILTSSESQEKSKDIVVIFEHLYVRWKDIYSISSKELKDRLGSMTLALRIKELEPSNLSEYERDTVEEACNVVEHWLKMIEIHK